MFHEITHLDYFINADAKVPYVSDLQVKTSVGGQWYEAYRPTYAKIIAQYYDTTDASSAGYFSRRNADNFAFYALAKYVESKTGHYPDRPKIGKRKPYGEPTDSKTGSPPALAQGNNSTAPQPVVSTNSTFPPLNLTMTESPDHYPGCPRKAGVQKSRSETNLQLLRHWLLRRPARLELVPEVE